MAVTQLATAADVEAALGRDLTSAEELKVGAILDKASELFRLEARRTFNAGTTTVRLKVNGKRVRLPESPVSAVSTVVDDDGDAVTYTRAGQWLTVDLDSSQFVTVTYTWTASVPDLVRLTVAEVAKKVLSIAPAATTGVTSLMEVDGPYTTQNSYAAWAIGGQTMLAPDDKAIARSFRERVPTVWVQPS